MILLGLNTTLKGEKKGCALRDKYTCSSWLFLGWNYHEISVKFCNNLPNISLRTFSVPKDYFRLSIAGVLLDAAEHNFESYSNISVAQVFIDSLEREYVKKLKMQLKTF